MLGDLEDNFKGSCCYPVHLNLTPRGSSWEVWYPTFWTSLQTTPLREGFFLEISLEWYHEKRWPWAQKSAFPFTAVCVSCEEKMFTLFGIWYVCRILPQTLQFNPFSNFEAGILFNLCFSEEDTSAWKSISLSSSHIVNIGPVTRNPY